MFNRNQPPCTAKTMPFKICCKYLMVYEMQHEGRPITGNLSSDFWFQLKRSGRGKNAWTQAPGLVRDTLGKGQGKQTWKAGASTVRNIFGERHKAGNLTERKREAHLPLPGYVYSDGKISTYPRPFHLRLAPSRFSFSASRRSWLRWLSSNRPPKRHSAAQSVRPWLDR